MPRFARFAVSAIALLLALSVFTGPGCDKGPARECDKSFPNCGPGLTCDFGSSTCVPPNESVCVQAGLNCTGATPYCYPEGVECVACKVDKSTNECASNWICDKRQCAPCSDDTVCLDETGDISTICRIDGGCAQAPDVAYVADNGTQAADCSFAAPCTLAKALATTKKYVRVASGDYTVTEALAINREVQIYGARDASTTITRSNAGAIFEISGTGVVGFNSIGITGASGTGGNAITVTAGAPKLELYRADLFGNAGLGISGGNASLKISSSLIADNGGGGLSGNGAFQLENNYFVGNGAAASNGGALNLSSNAAGNLIRFNTFANNVGAPRAVSCGGAAVKVTSNIFSGPAPQTANCTTSYSLFSVTPGTLGSNDLVGNPTFGATAFSDRDRDELDYYQIQAGSPAINKGENVGDEKVMNTDFYGNPRFTTIDRLRDIGASEFAE